MLLLGLQNEVLSMVFTEIYSRFMEIIFAPVRNTEMMWILVPVIASLLLMELYFKRYADEGLGWDTAFGNSLVLIFVSIDLFRFLHGSGMLEYVALENALVIAVALLGLMLTLTSFFHILPKQMVFGFSSRLPVNVIACLAVIIIYSGISIDVYTAIVSVIFTVLVWLLLKAFDMLIPESGEIPELENIESEEEK